VEARLLEFFASFSVFESLAGALRPLQRGQSPQPSDTSGKAEQPQN